MLLHRNLPPIWGKFEVIKRIYERIFLSCGRVLLQSFGFCGNFLVRGHPTNGMSFFHRASLHFLLQIIGDK